MSQPRSLGRMEMFAALQHRDYRLLWYGSVMAGLSHWAMVLGQGWLVLRLTDSAMWVGVIVFAAMMPFLLSPLIGGTLADRFDRRRLLAAAYILNFGANSVLAALTASNQVEVWHVMAVAMASGLARSAETPTTQSLIPNLIPRRDLLNGVALHAVALQGTRLLGAALSAPLLGTVGPAGAFTVAAVSYAVGTIWVFRIGTPSRGEAQPITRVLQNLMGGLRYLYGHSMVAMMFLMVAFHCSLSMSYEALLPSFSRDVLKGGGATYSYLVMAVGAGALAGALALAALRDEHRRGQWLLITGVFSALTLMLLSTSTTMPVAMVVAVGIGVSQAAFMTLTNAMIQTVVPDALRGRISSLYSMHGGGTMALSNLLNGYLADVFGTRLLLLVPGTIFLLVMVSASALQGGLRRVYRTGTLPTT